MATSTLISLVLAVLMIGFGAVIFWGFTKKVRPNVFDWLLLWWLVGTTLESVLDDFGFEWVESVWFVLSSFAAGVLGVWRGNFCRMVRAERASQK
jgi:hypothetical protein